VLQSFEDADLSVLNLRTSYQMMPPSKLFGLINNALNEQYYAAGTIFSVGGAPVSSALSTSPPFATYAVGTSGGL